MLAQNDLAVKRRNSLEAERRSLAFRRPRAFSDPGESVSYLPAIVDSLLGHASKAVKAVVPDENYQPVSEANPFVVFIVTLVGVEARGVRVTLARRWRLEGPLQGDGRLEAKASRHPTLAARIGHRANRAELRGFLYLVVRIQLNGHRLERTCAFRLVAPTPDEMEPTTGE